MPRMRRIMWNPEGILENPLAVPRLMVKVNIKLEAGHRGMYL